MNLNCCCRAPINHACLQSRFFTDQTRGERGANLLPEWTTRKERKKERKNFFPISPGSEDSRINLACLPRAKREMGILLALLSASFSPLFFALFFLSYFNLGLIAGAFTPSPLVLNRSRNAMGLKGGKSNRRQKKRKLIHFSSSHTISIEGCFKSQRKTGEEQKIGRLELNKTRTSIFKLFHQQIHFSDDKNLTPFTHRASHTTYVSKHRGCGPINPLLWPKKNCSEQKSGFRASWYQRKKGFCLHKSGTPLRKWVAGHTAASAQKYSVRTLKRSNIRKEKKDGNTGGHIIRHHRRKEEGSRLRPFITHFAQSDHVSP